MFAGLILLSAWLVTSTRKNRNKIAYLKSQIAHMKKILIKIEHNGKENQTQKGQKA